MKVSVIIGYNQDRGWLDQAIASVHNQDYTGEIEFILEQSDNTIGFNLNRGIEKATGSMIKYLSEDDILPPNSIQDSVDGISDYDWIHANAINFFPSGHSELYIPPITTPDLKVMLSGCPIHGGTIFFRKDVFDRFGLFDESLTSAEELEYKLRITKGGAKLGYINKTVYHYRRHNNQKSLGANVDQVARLAKIEAIRNRYR